MVVEGFVEGFVEGVVEGVVDGDFGGEHEGKGWGVLGGVCGDEVGLGGEAGFALLLAFKGGAFEGGGPAVFDVGGFGFDGALFVALEEELHEVFVVEVFAADAAFLGEAGAVEVGVGFGVEAGDGFGVDDFIPAVVFLGGFPCHALFDDVGFNRNANVCTDSFDLSVANNDDSVFNRVTSQRHDLGTLDRERIRCG